MTGHKVPQRLADFLDHPSEEVRSAATQLLESYHDLDELSRAWIDRHYEELWNGLRSARSGK